MENMQNINNGVVAQRASESLQFSAHAQGRLKSRGIDFGAEMLSKIENAVDSVAKKGATKDSLVLMKDMALIVNIKNRTVITAMDRDSVKDNVFTNIESAVLV